MSQVLKNYYKPRLNTKQHQSNFKILNKNKIIKNKTIKFSFNFLRIDILY